MSAINYAILTADKNTAGSIAQWVNSSTIQNATAYIVNEAEAWIYRRLRHWQMLTAPVTGTFVVNQDSLPLPLDMLEPFFFCITGTNFQVLTQKPPQEVVQAWNYDGFGNRVAQQPLVYYFDQGNFRFDSPADQQYPYALIYYQQPASIASVNTNFLTTLYPRLLRCACMAAACEWMKDSGQGNYDRTYWDQLAQDEIEKAQMESDRARRASVAAAQYPGDYPGAPVLW